MTFIKHGFFGHESLYHHFLHKKFGGGLIEDLQQLPGQFKIDSLDHKEYFEKYLMEPEGADRLVSAIKTICHYQEPTHAYNVRLCTIPYQTGVNKFCQNHLGDNLNHIFVVFESFGQGKTGDGSKANGHFMLLWHFPDTFNKKERSRNKYCLFDPFGRERKNDPEQYYFQKAKDMDYQAPDSSTCALWCVFALLQFVLQVTRFPGVSPVEYNGKEETLDMASFEDLHERQFRENEMLLYRGLLKNYFIFQPRLPNQRPLTQ